MPRRRSFGKSLRVNTKGPRITSISAGGSGLRVNLSSRGVRTTVRNPITGRSSTVSGGRRRRKQSKRGTAPETPTWIERSGIHDVTIPFSDDLTLMVQADVGQYTLKRLTAIQVATEKGRIKDQARELFRIVKAWDLQMDNGKIARRDPSTLKQLPEGFALAVAIEIGNRAGVIVPPIDSGITYGRTRGSRTPQPSPEKDEPPARRKGCLRRLVPFG